MDRKYYLRPQCYHVKTITTYIKQRNDIPQPLRTEIPQLLYATQRMGLVSAHQVSVLWLDERELESNEQRSLSRRRQMRTARGLREDALRELGEDGVDREQHHGAGSHDADDEPAGFECTARSGPLDHTDLLVRPHQDVVVITLVAAPRRRSPGPATTQQPTLSECCKVTYNTWILGFRVYCLGSRFI